MKNGPRPRPIVPLGRAALPDGPELAIVTTYRCREEVGGASVAWEWHFLEDGSLLERLAEGWRRYDRHLELPPGSERHLALTAEDGALLRFERRVRRRAIGRWPVRVTIDGVEYRLVATGTAAVERAGAEPPLGAWRTFGADPTDNVYFALEAERDPDVLGRGIWTTGVALSLGRAVDGVVLRDAPTGP